MKFSVYTLCGGDGYAYAHKKKERWHDDGTDFFKYDIFRDPADANEGMEKI